MIWCALLCLAPFAIHDSIKELQEESKKKKKKKEIAFRYSEVVLVRDYLRDSLLQEEKKKNSDSFFFGRTCVACSPIKQSHTPQ